MHRKLIATCAALVALGAGMAIPALASATSPILTETGVPLVAGANTKITAIGEETSTFTSGFITVHCNDFWLTGNVHKNSGTEILANVTAASFNSESGGVTTDCSSTLGATKVTVAAPNWCIKAGGTLETDKGRVEPHACTGAGGEFTFTLHVTNAPFLGTQICHYKRTASIVGSFTTNVTPATLKLENEPEFSLHGEGNSGGCSATGKLVKLNAQLYTDTATHALSTGDPLTIS